MYVACFFLCFTDNPASRLCVDYEHCLFRPKRISRRLTPPPPPSPSGPFMFRIRANRGRERRGSALFSYVLELGIYWLYCASGLFVSDQGAQVGSCRSRTKIWAQVLCSLRCIIGTAYWFKKAWVAIGSLSTHLLFGNRSIRIFGSVACASCNLSKPSFAIRLYRWGQQLEASFFSVGICLVLKTGLTEITADQHWHNSCHPRTVTFA